MEKKKLNLILKKIERCNNEFLVKDILRIILMRKLHQDNVHSVIGDIGIKRYNQRKIIKIIEELRRIPNIHIKNNGAVLYYKSLSPACKHCVEDLGCTVRPTIQCNRNCFFCFTGSSSSLNKKNPDIVALKGIINKKLKEVRFRSFAISGGEPFLYPKVVFELLEYINKKLNNKIYTRVYTNGDLVNEKILIKLKKLGLNEIRYSIKPLEEPNISLLKITKKYISRVLVEVPVLPNSENFMKRLIYKLDKVGVDGVNLLELFFNGYQVNNFKEKKYKIDIDFEKIREFYNAKPSYEYPIYGSGFACLKLIKYFSVKKVNLFINFCSQRTKQLQYDVNNKRAAIRNKPIYSKITKKNTHKILAIYFNIKNAKSELILRGKKDFYLRRIEGRIQRLETNVQYYKYFIKSNYLLVTIYRDANNAHDVDFDLTSVRWEKQRNKKIFKLINNFRLCYLN